MANAHEKSEGHTLALWFMLLVLRNDAEADEEH
jgi:hypothetical protein